LVPKALSALGARAALTLYYDTVNGNLVFNDYNIVSCVFSPEYPSFKEAMSLLLGKSPTVGIALCREFALFLGAMPKNPLRLFYKRNLAASSEDGNKWKIVSEEMKDMIYRHLQDFPRQ
jgi:hypothetical protein